MYIKINKKFDKRRDCNNLQFSVIESFRDGVKVKHRTLAYLATISESSLNHMYRLEDFWKDAERRLEVFAEADRAKLVVRLETIVPRPSEEMREEAERRYEELTAKLSQLRGFDPLRSQNPFL
jgi:hypothetical protein